VYIEERAFIPETMTGKRRRGRGGTGGGFLGGGGGGHPTSRAIHPGAPKAGSLEQTDKKTGVFPVKNLHSGNIEKRVKILLDRVCAN